MAGIIPTGTVTFLFTDIEGSTRLWELYPTTMGTALTRHDALLRQAIESQAGYVFKTVGDAFCAAFTTAPQAFEAAIAAQLALHKAQSLNENPSVSNSGPTLRVRMALHTGVVEARDGDYFGQPLNRLARLLSTGHGGQVLLSAATQELVRDHLPEDTRLEDLGVHRLKDLTRPERVFQLVGQGLPSDFLPLKSLSSFQTNLPIQLTSFIGREREMAELKQLLNQARLLTLTGSGGAGKTRLSLQVAAELLESFENGIWFVELAPLSDPALVPHTVAYVLKVREEPNRLIVETLVNYLHQKRILLILDNCEHLIEATAQLADSLLRACPDLHILASSREALGIGGEAIYRVPSLSLPEQTTQQTVAGLSQYEAVRLFIERAMAIQPDFTVTNQNAPALAQICSTLDGIPLAIELAAARVKSLSLEQIAIRLNDRFRLLTAGSRTAMPRQQTLKATIDWSYNLITIAEQKLLQRLAVFAGGCTLEAVEAVCAEEGIEAHEVLDLLAQLVNKSLVIAEEYKEEKRYHLLETIRQYGREKLENQGQSNLILARHAEYFRVMAQTQGPRLMGTEVAEAATQLEREHDNLRTALDWAFLQSKLELVLEFDRGLFLFWLTRYHCSEGRSYLTQTLALPGLDQPERMWDRATCLYNISFLTHRQGSFDEARELALVGLELFRELDDKTNMARCLNVLGLVSYDQGDYASTRRYKEEMLVLAREVGDKVSTAISLGGLGMVALVEEDFDSAQRYLEEDLSIALEVGWKKGSHVARANLILIAIQQGNYQTALANFKESMIADDGPTVWEGIAHGFAGLALLASYLGSKGRVPSVRVQQDYLTRAARFSGIVSSILMDTKSVLSRPERHYHEQAQEIARQGLGEVAFATAFGEGKAMPRDQIKEYAMSMEIITSDAAEIVKSPLSTDADQEKLTSRELEVLKLVAAGLTDPQIAEKLSLSPRTVNAHLRSIFSKLDVTTRSAATRYALEHNLV